METSSWALGFVWESLLPCNISSFQHNSNAQLDLGQPLTWGVQPVGLKRALSLETIWWALASDL